MSIASFRIHGGREGERAFRGYRTLPPGRFVPAGRRKAPGTPRPPDPTPPVTPPGRGRRRSGGAHARNGADRAEPEARGGRRGRRRTGLRSEEHTSELQSREKLVCRLL